MSIQELHNLERQQAAQFIANAVTSMNIPLSDLQVFAWDPDGKECQEAVEEIAGRAQLILELAKFLYDKT